MIRSMTRSRSPCVISVIWALSESVLSLLWAGGESAATWAGAGGCCGARRKVCDQVIEHDGEFGFADFCTSGNHAVCPWLKVQEEKKVKAKVSGERVTLNEVGL